MEKQSSYWKKRYKIKVQKLIVATFLLGSFFDLEYIGDLEVGLPPVVGKLVEATGAFDVTVYGPRGRAKAVTANLAHFRSHYRSPVPHAHQDRELGILGHDFRFL